MDHSDSILNLINSKGPMIPSEVKKTVNIDLMFVQAYLAQLSSSKKLKVSRVKIGGSPLYYVPGQESQLEPYIGRLKAPEQKIVLVLKEGKIIDDSILEPVDRVALKNSRDYAILLNVKINGSEKLFWKYFLTSDDEAANIIRSKLQPKSESIAQKPEDSKVVEKIEEVKPEPIVEKIPEISEQTQTSKLEEELSQLKEKLNSLTNSKPLEENNFKQSLGTTSSNSETKPKEIKKEQKSEVETKLDNYSKPEPDDEFYAEVKDYLTKKQIKILNFELIKKKSDIDLTISVPTPFGNLEFYCKAKSKKKSNEGDLSSAFLKGNFLNLPSIYLTKGQATKKSLDKLQQEYKGLLYKEF